MPASFADLLPFRALAADGELIRTKEDALAVTADLLLNAARYADCRLPTAILGGTHDIVVNNAVQGRHLGGIMPGARFEWVVAAGHMLQHVEAARLKAAIVRIAKTAAA